MACLCRPFNRNFVVHKCHLMQRYWSNPSHLGISILLQRSTHEPKTGADFPQKHRSSCRPCTPPLQIPYPYILWHPGVSIPLAHGPFFLCSVSLTCENSNTACIRRCRLDGRFEMAPWSIFHSYDCSTSMFHLVVPQPSCTGFYPVHFETETMQINNPLIIPLATHFEHPSTHEHEVQSMLECNT